MDKQTQILQQVERALKKTASKFQLELENPPLTDLHIQVKQESGELLVFDDDDKELTRCVVEEWIGNTDEKFYEQVQPLLTSCLDNMRSTWNSLCLLKPFFFVLVGEDKETIAELYLVDDDTIMLSEDLMKGLDKDLDAFWEELAKR